MRILVLENEPSTGRGGQERSLYDVCRGLAGRGHAIELLYTDDGDLLDGYRGFARRIDRVAHYAIDRARPARATLRLLADASQWARSAPDLIYANQYQDSFYARVLALRFARPFVCHLRLPPPDRFCAQYRWGMRGAVRVITISQATRREYVASGLREDRIDVVHNGLDLDEWRPRVSRTDARRMLGVPEDAIVVGFAGRLHHQKGVDVLIDALSLLPDRWIAVVAGKNWPDGSGREYGAELRAHAERRGVAARCHFLGHVPQIEMVYTAADVTALPSIWSEAFGRTIIESMACGTPVVGSRLGGIPEILDGEFARGLCEPAVPRALADRLLDAHAWRQADAQLGNRCRQHVQARFGLAQMVTGVETVLERVVAEWRGAGN